MKFRDWIADVATDQWMIYIKRLSANDTGATKSHQVGIYFPKHVLGELFPSISRTDHKNPDTYFTAVVDSDDVPEHQLRAIYYNNRFFGVKNGRDEKRVTQWKKHVDYTPLQDKEKTGSIAIFAFNANPSGNSEYMKAWVCRNLEEEDYLEERVGEIDPLSTYFDRGDATFEGLFSTGTISMEEYPAEWNQEFPSGAAIIQYLFERRFHSSLDVDKRILKRRTHEFNLFKLVEHKHTFPLIKDGFDNVDEFIELANRVLNRRKSRSGKSLELHLEKIFLEENLTTFGTQCRTEVNKRPDFLFPSCEAYNTETFPDERLRMLAVKTTVKDRWRQITGEANRIDSPYLFTLQKGVSENQFQEMKEQNVVLVVPKSLHETYPKPIRHELRTLAGFIAETRRVYKDY